MKWRKEKAVSEKYTASIENSQPIAEMPPQEALQATVEELTRVMEKTRIAEYVQYLDHPWKLLWSNFLIGIARGLGSTIGLAIIVAIAFFVLQHIVMLNLPFISDMITKMIYTIQENLRYFQGGTF